MRRLGADPYLPAIRAGLGTIMVSDALWNGQNMTSHKHLITDILKGDYKFKGPVVTDWEAAAQAGGVIATVNAGVDMLMQPTDWAKVADDIAAAAGSAIPNERIDDAVRRILSVKCQAGLFDWKRDPALLKEIGSAAHRSVARQAVRESLVLLQNQNAALPLAKGQKIWIGGTGADNLERQCGGWTVSWQDGGSKTKGTTIRAAVAKHATIVTDMAQADAGIVVLSEKSYAEFLGDSASVKTLPVADFAFLKQLKDQGKKVIAIVVSGRPVLITEHLANADAWIAAWLPGSEGDGVADVLFGDYAPTGKLSHSWPKDDKQVAINFGEPGYDPLFKLGFGLTY
jgi:beta-glucosidase